MVEELHLFLHFASLKVLYPFLGDGLNNALGAFNRGFEPDKAGVVVNVASSGSSQRIEWLGIPGEFLIEEHVYYHNRVRKKH